MQKRVYIETTVASYLTARPNRELIVAAHHELTVDWWTNHRQRFDIYISDIVLREAARGDESAAAKRLAQLEGLAVLDIDDRAGDLARLFVKRGLIPAKATEDALHVSIATCNGIDFLLTWNGKHIANAEVVQRLEAVLQEMGYRIPVLCTPEQLMGD